MRQKAGAGVTHLLSALMHATIFGNVASIVGRMYARRAEYDKKVIIIYPILPPGILSFYLTLIIGQVLDLEHFAKVHKLPREVKQRFGVVVVL